jgi:phosphate transport system protein
VDAKRPTGLVTRPTSGCQILTPPLLADRTVVESVTAPQTRSAFIEELRQLEVETLDALDMLAETLERTLEALRERDLELARRVVADDDRIDDCYLDVDERVVRLLATEAPVGTDLRLATALVDVIGHVERIGDQCVNVAKLILLTGGEADVERALLDAVQRMGSLAVQQIRQAEHAFALRDSSRAPDLLHNRAALTRLDR